LGAVVMMVKVRSVSPFAGSRQRSHRPANAIGMPSAIAMR
jgi:hypothetical protein